MPPLRRVARISDDGKVSWWIPEGIVFSKKLNELTAILNRLRKAACSGAVVRLCDFFTIHHQWPSMEVVTLIDLPIRRLLMHVSQVLLHAFRGEHVNVLDTEGLENVLLEVIVEGHPGHAFHDGPCPVDAHPVLPLRTGLKDEGLA